MNALQPAYKRQRFLLSFIRQINENISATDLQKLVFLYTINKDFAHYEFLPYKYGSYSFQLADDVDVLRRDGFVTVDDTRVKAVGKYQQEVLYDIPTERGDNLIRKAYRANPYYTVNSEIIPRLFSKQDTEVFLSERQKYNQSEQILFTIGYEGKSIEGFINSLIHNGIRLLCDVRKNSLSRKFGFSKSKLEHIANIAGIKYVHLPDLGIESDKRKPLDSPDDYRVLFEDYSKTLPSLNVHLDHISTLLQTNIRIALMCYENDATMCHRHVIRDYIAKTHQVRSVDL